MLPPYNGTVRGKRFAGGRSPGIASSGADSDGSAAFLPAGPTRWIPGAPPALPPYRPSRISFSIRAPVTSSAFRHKRPIDYTPCDTQPDCRCRPAAMRDHRHPEWRRRLDAEPISLKISPPAPTHFAHPPPVTLSHRRWPPERPLFCQPGSRSGEYGSTGPSMEFGRTRSITRAASSPRNVPAAPPGTALLGANSAGRNRIDSTDAPAGGGDQPIAQTFPETARRCRGHPR